MARTIYNDHKRYLEQYWQEYPGSYFTQDHASCDEDGYFWILGRTDDVLNVSGHRISTMEIESALVSHKSVAEAAVVEREDKIKGSAICCFLTLKNQENPSETLKQEIKQHVRKKIGPLATPDSVFIPNVLPKTRSGKIMRRLLRDIVEKRTPQGDLSTIEDLNSLTKLVQSVETNRSHTNTQPLS